MELEWCQAFMEVLEVELFGSLLPPPLTFIIPQLELMAVGEKLRSMNKAALVEVVEVPSRFKCRT